MSDFKVRAVDFEEKSKVELEQELIEQHEQKLAEAEVAAKEVNTEEMTEESIQVITDQPTQVELKDEDVLSHIKNRYGREINSIDELFSKREETEDLDPEIAMYMKYKKDTGRSYSDFVKLNRDLDKEDPVRLIAEWKKVTDDLDDEDVEYEMRKLIIDEDYDTEDEIKEKKLLQKKEFKKAKSYFEKEKEQYSVPLESRKSLADDPEVEEFKAYKQNKQSELSMQEETLKRQKYFAEKTDALFNDKFEGFKFVVDEESFVYKPADVKSLKDQQSSLQNFVASLLDENGYLKDAEDYHRRIAIAMNPDKFAQFFIEQGRAMGVESIAKETKNIDMDARSSTQVVKKQGGFQVRAVDSGYEGGYKIRKR